MPTASRPRIQALRVQAVRVPMREAHQTASGAVMESPLVLTDVTTDDGTVGHSVVFGCVLPMQPVRVWSGMRAQRALGAARATMASSFFSQQNLLTA